MTTEKIDRFQSLQALPVSTAVIDATGRIVAVNEAWKTFAKRNGLRLENFGVGANYFDFCPPPESSDVDISTELKALLEGRSNLVTTIYPCHSPTQQRWFSLIGIPLSINRPSGVAVVHAELTSLLPLTPGPSITSAKGAASVPAAGVLCAIEQSVTDTLARQLRAMIESPGNDALADGDLSSRLSKKQLDVLKLLGEGKTNAEIAKALFRSPHTIKLHVSAILRQLNLKSRTQAALLASRLLELGGKDPLPPN